jgi:hypothetical protein
MLIFLSKMKKHVCLLVASICILFAGCGGSYTVTRTAAKAPEQIRSASFSRQDGNSPEVTGYVTDALLSQGVEIRSVPANKGNKSGDADAVVSYLDVWRWDMGMYLKSISINLYNANTGELLVNGKWADSFLHAFHRGEMVANELVSQMFAKLDLKQPTNGEMSQAVGGVNDAKPLAANPNTAQSSSTPNAKPTKSDAKLVSRYEYEARQQARSLNCRPDAILAIEGTAGAREEISFDCGEGRKVTIICRSGLGCA